MYGIDQIKSGMTTVFKLVLLLVDIVKKFDVTKIVALATVLWEGRGIDFKLLWKQAKDISTTEAYDLSRHFADVAFDIEDNVLEAEIEKAVSFIPKLYDLIDRSLVPIRLMTAPGTTTKARIGHALEFGSILFQGWNTITEFVDSVKDVFDNETALLTAPSEAIVIANK